MGGRYDYLSNAVLQARSGSRAPGGLGPPSELSDSGLMELLEGKLAVLRFQQKIKDALDRIASGGSAEEGGSMPMEEDGFPFQRAFTGAFADESRAQAAREKSEELGSELKSITQLYNDYACRFELWEVSCFVVYVRSGGRWCESGCECGWGMSWEKRGSCSSAAKRLGMRHTVVVTICDVDMGTRMVTSPRRVAVAEA